MAQYFTDDFADLNAGGTLPDYGDWTQRYRQNETFIYSLTGGDLVVDTTGSTDWKALSWDDIDGDADRDDVEILFVWSTPTTPKFLAIVRGSGADESATLYSIYISSSTIRTYYCSGSDAPTQIASTSKTHAVDTDYWCRFRVNGTTVQAKTWSGAIGDEPGSWDCDSTDSNVSGAGWAGPAGYNNNNTPSVTYKQFGVGTNGDTAPHEAGGGAVSVSVDAGAVSVSGQTLTGRTNVAVTAGAVSVAGQTLTGAIDVAVTAGAVSVAGQDITVAKTDDLFLAIEAGAVSVAGQDITVAAGNDLSVSIDAGSVTVAGQAITVTLPVNLALEIDAGAVSVSGQAQSANIGVAVAAGAVSVAGQTVGIGMGLALDTPGEISVAGQDVAVSLPVDLELEIDAGAVYVAGQTIGLRIVSEVAVYASSANSTQRARGGRMAQTSGRERAAQASTRRRIN